MTAGTARRPPEMMWLTSTDNLITYNAPVDSAECRLTSPRLTSQCGDSALPAMVPCPPSTAMREAIINQWCLSNTDLDLDLATWQSGFTPGGPPERGGRWEAGGGSRESGEEDWTRLVPLSVELSALSIELYDPNGRLVLHTRIDSKGTDTITRKTPSRQQTASRPTAQHNITQIRPAKPQASFSPRDNQEIPAPSAFFATVRGTDDTTTNGSPRASAAVWPFTQLGSSPARKTMPQPDGMRSDSLPLLFPQLSRRPVTDTITAHHPRGVLP
ncbi:hypothetical protein CMUS01_02142 [Colletotrichum musicola]|uniref:Uncharacterized protein n=1 Tax=Colletotrichum musicola TaxID=2175873 RepID=A0A8H6NVM2_9PEZI|nr:hypothetical protein CMUS01_02142 [Colletotrichum musicola]